MKNKTIGDLKKLIIILEERNRIMEIELKKIKVERDSLLQIEGHFRFERGRNETYEKIFGQILSNPAFINKNNQ